VVIACKDVGGSRVRNGREPDSGWEMSCEGVRVVSPPTAFPGLRADRCSLSGAMALERHRETNGGRRCGIHAEANHLDGPPLLSVGVPSRRGLDPAADDTHDTHAIPWSCLTED
jgi:hypothetical protein